MASEDDYGLSAYEAIQSQLEQWGESPAPSSSRKSRSSVNSEGTAFFDTFESPTGLKSPRTPVREGVDIGAAGYQDDGDDNDSDLGSPTRLRKGGVETPMPSRGEQQEQDREDVYEMDNENAQDVIEEEETALVFDGVDSYQPYRDALLSYLQNRDRIANLTLSLGEQREEGGNALMQIDDTPEPSTEDAVALEEADMKFLDSLASICFSRSNTVSNPDRHEGNLWDLMSSLRSRGLPALFYCVGGETPPELELNADPRSMIDAYPSQVVNACLGSTEDQPACLPLERLNAALEWIQACHNRKWEILRSDDYLNTLDPLLPPPRRRTMWPSTLESMKQTNTKQFHPDAPICRSNSPTDVTLHPSDEADDARLLRACLTLIQAGRPEQAIELTKECGQPWRAISWLGGEPLDESGNGNPTRRLWKRMSRKILHQMMGMIHDEEGRPLYSSIAYEAAILAVLSDNVDCAAKNPVFDTWEDGVHAILSSERGVIEENVLLAHDDARVEAVGESKSCFPYPGMEGGDDVALGGFHGDMGAALEKLDVWSSSVVRESNAEPYRNGMRSFLIGQEALKYYIEECAVLALKLGPDDDASFLRFMVHLVLYVDTVLPEFAFQLEVPQDVTTDETLREVLLLKYINHLKSMRELWGYIPLYTSLLSNENILATFSQFLRHVHTDQERQMMLSQARDFFPSGLDCYVLRNVVREMIQSDETRWIRGLGEDAPPAGIPLPQVRKMKSVLWLCYYPEHYPDALVCANMLLRRFMLTESNDQYSKKYLFPAKYFIEQILPKDIIDTAGAQSQDMDEAIAGSISFQMVLNLQAEFLSMKRFFQAHISYLNFINVINKTSPCQKSESKSVKGSSTYETEIAAKMERNTARKAKVGLCKIIIEYATKASDALMEVLTLGGGWLVDQTLSDDEEVDMSDEAHARSQELKQIRSVFVPMTVFMLHEVLNKTAMWMEQIVYDTLDHFGSASPDMLLTLFSTFDESDDVSNELLKTSPAAPAHWHRRAISIAHLVANDVYVLQESIGGDDMNKFLNLVADSQVRYNECADADALFDL